MSLFVAAATLTLAVRDLYAQTHAEEVEGVIEAIQWLLRDAPKRPLTQDSEKQRRIAEAVVAVGQKRGICPYLLLANAFAESSLKRHVRGTIGERGMMQVHGAAIKGCNLKTYHGQLDCGARWLQRSIGRCGSVRKGIAAYMSGSCRLRPFSRKEYLVQRRLDLWNWLRRVADASSDGEPRSWRYRNE